MQKVDQAIEPAQIRTMAQRVEDRMLVIIAARQSKGSGLELRTAYAAHLEQMRQKLGAGDDLMEALLVERIILTWVRLMFVEEQAAYTLMGDSSAALAEQWDRRLNDANSRFLKSCLALERVRKLRRRPSMSGAAISALLGQPQTLGDLPRMRLTK